MSRDLPRGGGSSADSLVRGGRTWQCGRWQWLVSVRSWDRCGHGSGGGGDGGRIGGGIPEGRITSGGGGTRAVCGRWEKQKRRRRRQRTYLVAGEAEGTGWRQRLVAEEGEGSYGRQRRRHLRRLRGAEGAQWWRRAARVPEGDRAKPVIRAGGGGVWCCVGLAAVAGWRCR
jgi:hypothetical protein